MLFCHASAADSDRPVSGVARMHQRENRDRDVRIMTLLHQIHDRIGVERITQHKPLKDAAEGLAHTSALRLRANVEGVSDTCKGILRSFTKPISPALL